MRAWTAGLLAIAALATLGFVAYANTFDGEWVWDDASSVLLHRNVQDPGQLMQLFREDQHAFGRGAGNFYRPLLSVSFMIDYLLSYDPTQDADPASPYPDLKPFVFHLSSLLWHVAAAVFLFFLLARIGASSLVQWAAATVYVVHPLHTEAVAYISGRADMMSAAFLFSALFCALTTAQGARRYAIWGLSLLLFACGLLSKESSLIYPVLLGVVLLIGSPATTSDPPLSWKRRILTPPFLGAIAVLIVYIVLRSTVLQFAEAGASTAAPLATRLVEVGQAFAFYLRVLFWPTGLHMEQTLDGVPLWTSGIGWVAIILLIASAVLAFKQGHRLITLGIAWFLAAWLPISGIFPLNAPMAEHWMYVPMAGFWWALFETARVVLGSQTSRRLVPVATAALVLLFTILTNQRNEDWHDNERLFRSTLAENPASLRVQYNLAVAYEDLMDNPAGAVRHYREVLAAYAAQRRSTGNTGLSEDEIEVRLSLAEALRELDRFQEAAAEYAPLMGLQQQDRFAPIIARAALGLGKSLLALGQVPQAQEALGRAVNADAALFPEVSALLQGAPLTAG